MILKVMVEHPCGHSFGGSTSGTYIERLFADFDDIELCGPVYVTDPNAGLSDSEMTRFSDAEAGRAESLINDVFNDACELADLTPAGIVHPPLPPSFEYVNALGRPCRRVDIEFNVGGDGSRDNPGQMRVWWATLTSPGRQRYVFFNGPGYLCDNNGTTIQRVGGYLKDPTPSAEPVDRETASAD